MKQLESAAIAFIDECKDANIDDARLSDYLRATDQLPLNRSERLIALAARLREQLGWRRVCAIYENILKNEPAEEQIGTYASWLTFSLDCWMREKGGLPIKDRVEVAEDTFKHLRRALKISPHNSGLALSCASFYFNHPLRSAGANDYLEKSLEWSKTAINWAAEDRDDEVRFCALIQAGNCYFDLGQWEQALVTYQSLDKAQLREYEMNEGVSDIPKKIAICKERIEQ